MKIEEIALELDRLTKLVDDGAFDKAYEGIDSLCEAVNKLVEADNSLLKVFSNIACIFIDLGHMIPSVESTKKGIELLVKYKNEIVEHVGNDGYYYNLGNAKSDLISEKNPFKNDFLTIEQLVEVKNDYWKAINFSSLDNPSQFPPTHVVNLANSLKKQFRISEALDCYDRINALNLDIPQAWINRSETLIMLNQVSNTYSIQMLKEIKQGYENILLSKQIPPQWLNYYKEQVSFHQSKIEVALCDVGIELNIHDAAETQSEYQQLTSYRKFCLANNITLSEHGLYCACAGSARDNLTIPTARGVVGDFVIPMEMVLNRLKSEFSFARKLYFDYINNDQDDELLHESCFSELFNDELLGLDVERLRTSFRLCFGVLDKIGMAVCQLYDLHPPNGIVYFQNFWQLDQDNRREKFNKVKNPGLLALYSIATDLNEKKDGELSFLKQWRNDLEHKFVVVHKSDKPCDIYESYELMNDIVFIREDLFIENLKRLLQLTRSAIFSFVFTVRHKAGNAKKSDAIYISNNIGKKNYI